MDIKSISLGLFGEQVFISLKENSSSLKKFGKEITGRLIGRKWGEKLVVNNLTEKEETIQTVIGITIIRDGEGIELNSDDIEAIYLKN